ncbi:hypothetical protein [Streptomyces sp. NPDC091268]|uniref:hypothetical protein n=1 Tax=Streptomyces sp. NPDC091268 TaxID=3365979 RepID=UPI0038267F5E
MPITSMRAEGLTNRTGGRSGHGFVHELQITAHITTTGKIIRTALTHTVNGDLCG